ncbi:MAG: VWA domain-containing protein [Alphaproteobacteria bacterium]
MSMGRFAVGLAILVAAPALVFGGLALYVHLHNAASQAAAQLESRLDRGVVFTGEPVTQTITFPGERLSSVTTPPPPVDVALLVDVSGSMISSLPTMRAAAAQLAREMQGDRFRFSVMAFDTEAEVTVKTASGWTGSLTEVEQALDAVRKKTGDNDSRKMFLELSKLLETTRPGARKLAMIFTDGKITTCGCPSPMPWSEMAAESARLRELGVDFFAIGLPGSLDSRMAEITGDRNRLLVPASLADIVTQFRRVVAMSEETVARTATLTVPLDGRHVQMPSEGNDGWVPREGGVVRTVSPLAVTPQIFTHTFSIDSVGLWSVGTAPARLDYKRHDGTAVTRPTEVLPRLLVLSWWLVLLAALPALGWLLNALSFWLRTAPAPHPQPVPRVPGPRPTRPLRVPPPRHSGLSAVPTLFIGLGGVGLQGLAAIRDELRESHDGRAGAPYRFLHIDVDSVTPADTTSFRPWDAHPIERVTAPPEVAMLDGPWLSGGAAPPHLSWSDPLRHRDRSREELTLTRGAHGNRSLARVALFRWLEDGTLLAVLAEALDGLYAAESADDVRQIVLIADPAGGFGSASLIDIGRLVRRLTRDHQASAGGFVPETVAVLVTTNPSSTNGLALMAELETAQSSGLLPQRTCYRPGVPLLDREDGEPPFNWVFRLHANEPVAAARQAGILAPILADRGGRRPVLGAIHASQLRAEGLARPTLVLDAAASSVGVAPSLRRSAVREALLLRIIGGTSLLGLTPSAAGGGYEVPRLGEDQALKALTAWMEGEPPGTPWRTVLDGALNGATAEELQSAFDGLGAKANEWLTLTFARSVDRMLRIAPTARGAAPERGWTVPLAIASLEVLAVRLRGLGRLGGTTAELGALFEHMAKQSERLATRCAEWAAGLAVLCAESHRSLTAAVGKTATSTGTANRVLLDEATSMKELQAMAERLLSDWGGSEPGRLIETHLFFRTGLVAEGVDLSLHSDLGSSRDFPDPTSAADGVRGWAEAMIDALPSLTLAAAVAARSPDDRRHAFDGLTRPNDRPEAAAVVAPAGISLEDQVRSVWTAKAPTEIVPGSDPTAVRRLTWTVAGRGGLDALGATPLPVVQAADWAAERWRVQVAEHFERSVDVLPVPLRIAAADEEALRSFATAYQSGRIVRRPDDTGRPQWHFTNRSLMLTSDAENSLADALVAYARRARPLPDPADMAVVAGSQGDMRPLEVWRNGQIPSDWSAEDLSVLALIAVIGGEPS